MQKEKPVWAGERLVPVFTQRQKYAVLKDILENPTDYSFTKTCAYVGICNGNHMLDLHELLEQEGLMVRDRKSLLLFVTPKGKAFIGYFEIRTGEFLSWGDL